MCCIIYPCVAVRAIEAQNAPALPTPSNHHKVNTGHMMCTDSWDELPNAAVIPDRETDP